MTAVGAIRSRTFQSAETLAQGVAEWLCALGQAKDGDFAVCLSGGSTPRRLYEWLATPGNASRFPWNRSHWFWGDERFVPHEHPDSNYRMARDALLSRVPIPDDNIHAVPTEGLSPEQAAVAYETTLKRFYGADVLSPERPLFDVTLLGIGEDGHTASLFPGQPAIAGAPPVGGRGHRRKIGAAHHSDLPRARQQPRRRVPRDRGRKEGSRGRCKGWRLRVSRRPWFAQSGVSTGSRIARRRPEGVN